MVTETEPPRCLTGAEALRRTVSWALASWREQAGDAVWPDLSKAIGQACAQHLREACVRGEIGIDRAQTDAEKGDLSAAVINRGALHPLLATTPVETLYGPAPPKPANSSAIGMMTPLQAVQAALGVATGAAALDASYACRAHRNGWLADHKNGVAVLSPAALQGVKVAIKAAEDRDHAFAEATDKLWADIIAGKRIAIGRGPDGVARSLTGAAFTSDIVPDVASGRFRRRAGGPLAIDQPLAKFSHLVVRPATEIGHGRRCLTTPPRAFAFSPML